ncbi:MAG: hypothetical protein AAFV53_17810 [Myxococcota bacterium]
MSAQRPPQGDFFEEATQVLERQVRRQPYLTVGAAMGVGYILGGGVPGWLARAVFNVALRSVASSAFRNALANLDSGPPVD